MIGSRLNSCKKVLIGALVVSMLLSPTATAPTARAEQTPVSIGVYFVPMTFMFDGVILAPAENQQGFIYQDTTYVPLRFIAYSLSKSVEWEADSYTVKIKEPNASEKVGIEEYKLNHTVRKTVVPVDSSQTGETSISAYFEDVNYRFDGKEQTPPLGKEGMIIDDSLYVPLRFLSESIGKEIGWDSETYTVKVETVKAPEPVATPKPPKPTETPTPTPARPVGGGGGGGAVMQPTKVPYDTIINEAIAKILVISQTAETKMNGLKDRYFAERDPAKQEAIKNEAKAALAEFDSQFYSLMDQLESKLLANQYSTLIVSSYKVQYEAKKASEIEKLK